jgi:hypothetical protein
MEGSEADVGKFFVTERDRRARRKVRPLWNVASRHGRCRCTSR